MLDGPHTTPGLIAASILQDLPRYERFPTMRRISVDLPPWSTAITLPPSEYREVVQ